MKEKVKWKEWERDGGQGEVRRRGARDGGKQDEMREGRKKQRKRKNEVNLIILYEGIKAGRYRGEDEEPGDECSIG